MSNKINKHYVSEIDKFLADFDARRPSSASQKVEIEKHQRLFELRDNPKPSQNIEDIWEAF